MENFEDSASPFTKVFSWCLIACPLLAFFVQVIVLLAFGAHARIPALLNSPPTWLVMSSSFVLTPQLASFFSRRNGHSMSDNDAVWAKMVSRALAVLCGIVVVAMIVFGRGNFNGFE